MHSCSICKEFIYGITRPGIIKSPSSQSPDDSLVLIEQINVGWLYSIVEHSNDCTLYRLITRIWAEVSLLGEESDQTVVSEPFERIYVCLGDGSPATTENNIRWNWWLWVYFFYPGRSGVEPRPVPTKWKASFASLADDFPKVDLAKGVDPFELGRLRRHELRYDAQFLNDCFHTCLTESTLR